MNALIAFSALLAAASATPGLYAGVYAPTITQQYHAQDELGQYTYGYSGGPSAKEETRTFDGITRGSYSYIDGHGLVQSASYVSDPVNGFRVAATNLPVGPSAPAPAVAAIPAAVAVAPAAIAGPAHIAVAPAETPEVIAAKAAHFAAHNEAIARLGRKRRSIAAAPLALAVPASRFAYSSITAHAPVVAAAPIAYSAPTVVASHAPIAYSAHIAAPIAYSAPVAAPIAPAVPAITKTQYHAQDELGQYSYGYADGLSDKQESRRADGITTGGYSYLDSNGIIQKVSYIADGAGFRVSATNLPVGPA